MDNFWFTIVYVFIVGWIFSLPARLFPLRQWDASRRTLRIMAIGLTALLTFMLNHAIISRALASLDLLLVTCGDEESHAVQRDELADPVTGDCVPKDEPNQKRIERIEIEYWLKTALPFGHLCYSDADICADTDATMKRLTLPHVSGNYPSSGGIGLGTAVCAGFFIWLYSRPIAEQARSP